MGASALGAGAAGLLALRLSDRRDDEAIARELLASAHAAGRFDPRALAGLPEAARRYLRAVIAPGAPLRTVTRIEMGGTLDLGSAEAPAPRPMRASQILAPPLGFLWRVRAGRAISGTDALCGGSSHSRFRMAGLVPVGRSRGLDHLRSSFGRMAGEAAFWAPTALLPERGALWHDTGTADRARVTLARGGLSQTVEIALGADGLPRAVSFPRWSDANPERRFRLQPFGGRLARFRDFEGVQLPTRVAGGNGFGTPDWFPFFHAEVRSVRFA